MVAKRSVNRKKIW